MRFMSRHQTHLRPIHPLLLLPLGAHNLLRVCPQYLYPILPVSLPRRMGFLKFILRDWPAGRHRDGVSHRRHGDRPLQRQILCRFSLHSSFPLRNPSASFCQSALDYSALSGCDPVAPHLHLRHKERPRVVTLTGRHGVVQRHAGDA